MTKLSGWLRHWCQSFLLQRNGDAEERNPADGRYVGLLYQKQLRLAKNFYVVVVKKTTLVVANV
jgi:hypothetical protein